jgi:hypothetical protein
MTNDPRPALSFGGIAALSAALVTITGCHGSTPATAGYLPTSNIVAAANGDSTGMAKLAGALLYASTLDWSSGSGSVYVYRAYGKDTSSIRSLPFSTGFPDGLWTDRRGRVYVAVVNAGSNGRGYINVYTPGLTKLLKTYTAGLDGPAGGTFDSAGNMYVANLCGTAPSIGCNVFAKPKHRGMHVRSETKPGDGYSGYVAIYPPGATEPSQYLQSGINIAVDVAVDHAGNVFAVNNTGQAAWNVIEFPTGSTQGEIVPFKNLPDNLWVGAATFAPAGELVISANSSIDFFAHEKGKPSHVLTKGVFGADGLAYGADGTLFAGNYEFEQNEGNVVAFPPKAHAPARSFAVPYNSGVVNVAVGAAK